jgi:hypothetical protein
MTWQYNMNLSAARLRSHDLWNLMKSAEAYTMLGDGVALAGASNSMQRGALHVKAINLNRTSSEARSAVLTPIVRVRGLDRSDSGMHV